MFPMAQRGTTLASEQLAQRYGNQSAAPMEPEHLTPRRGTFLSRRRNVPRSGSSV